MKQISRRKLAHYIAQQLVDAGDTASALQQVAAHLHDTRRTAQVELLVRDVEVILARDYGHVVARVTTARPLGEQLKAQITAFVKAAESARSVELESREDASILGGVHVMTPRNEFDATVKRQLSALRGSL